MTPFMQPRSVSARARNEAYAGLLLLALGAVVLAVARCPPEEVPSFRPRLPGDILRLAGAPLPPGVGYGNAALDGAENHGWWVGHFRAEGSPQHSDDIETKWSQHATGQKNDGVAKNAYGTSMAILIAGVHRLEFSNAHVVLERIGDYVIWGPGIEHSWTVLDKSTVLTLRWPSKLHDQITVRAFGNKTATIDTGIEENSTVAPITVRNVVDSGADKLRVSS